MALNLLIMIHNILDLLLPGGERMGSCFLFVRNLDLKRFQSYKQVGDGNRMCWVLIISALVCCTGACLARRGGIPLSSHSDGDLLRAQVVLEPLPPCC